MVVAEEVVSSNAKDTGYWFEYQIPNLHFYSHVLFKFAKPASFCLFSFFSHDKYCKDLTLNDKSIDGVLWTRTQGGRMVGADESTDLWQHPN